MAGESNEYRRGFADCLGLIEDIVGSVKRLKHLKSYLLTIRASMKEKNVACIREDLGLQHLCVRASIWKKKRNRSCLWASYPISSSGFLAKIQGLHLCVTIPWQRAESINQSELDRLSPQQRVIQPYKSPNCVIYSFSKYSSAVGGRGSKPRRFLI